MRKQSTQFKVESNWSIAMSNTEEPIPRAPSPIIPILIFLGVLAVWIVNLVYGSKLDEPNRGLFGDMFGASNSLFSGMALAGVIYAILLQRNEMSIARRELHYTKSIFDEQSLQLSAQNKSTQKQNFESTFFQLLRMFTDLTEHLDVGIPPDQVYRGKDVFVLLQQKMARALKTIRQEGTAEPTFLQVYSRVYYAHENDLGHYFRSLYTILKFVEQSDAENKKFYANILRAQLSNSELELLLYNGLSPHGSEKLKPLLEKYEFFDNLPAANVGFKDALTKYELSAFGSNVGILNHLNGR
jgi:Putative phage abortive infection protein